ncbi:MAG: peptide chain release factor 2 [Legionellales bacterium]|nr:MAG: peptide chain release factor 2 [Legionellales bacterium]
MISFGGIFEYDDKCAKLKEIREQLTKQEVWQNLELNKTLLQESKALELTINQISQFSNKIQDAQVMLELLQEELDKEVLKDTADEVTKLAKELHALEFQKMFAGKFDKNNAYLEVQSGSGGTEAQDWANMLLRMYLRWGEAHNFKTTIMESSDGEVVGIKGATVLFEGDHAFGWLRTETGIHRLVRKSPFDSNNKRHTSFASVFVSAEIDDSIEIDINPADLRIDTYRASGAGGQHVNRTDSAVRITHLPTNTVVQCQNDRSQHKNKAQAMKQLKAKLYELEEAKRRSEQQIQEKNKDDIGWGSQIRSYVLDKARIKDLRTGVELTNTKAVLDGDIDAFIEACLKRGIK